MINEKFETSEMKKNLIISKNQSNEAQVFYRTVGKQTIRSLSMNVWLMDKRILYLKTRAADKKKITSSCGYQMRTS